MGRCNAEQRMKSLTLFVKRHARRLARNAFAAMPAALRRSLIRRTVDCEPLGAGRLELKIASTEAELEACFGLLHDAYVASGFMRPHPSGLRVTPYHALPTTTTLCAKVDGQVVGTLSIVREGVFGFPMQSVFDIDGVRAKGGRIAEISALAVHPKWRRTGGSILFPLMKFMYGYCTEYFDVRHLVIAVNPAHIEMYESVLFFRRLTQTVVDRYDFVNGAPAVGATLDLQEAPEVFQRAYGHKPGRRNLHRFFVHDALPAIRWPQRPWYTSNDPVLTPALLDHFFNRRVPVLAELDDRRLRLLHKLYDGSKWAEVMPPLAPGCDALAGLRREPRFSMKAPATLQLVGRSDLGPQRLTLLELSGHGCRARALRPLPEGARGLLTTELGPGVTSKVTVEIVRRARDDHGLSYGMSVSDPDPAWARCVTYLELECGVQDGTLIAGRPHGAAPGPAPSAEASPTGSGTPGSAVPADENEAQPA
jgi:GNAT superfamily N-acetyltransferase